MKIPIMALMISSVFFIQMSGQQQEGNESFTPGGRPLIRIYTNFHTEAFEEENASAFQLTRAYIGYEHKFSPEFSTGITLDVADPGAGKLQHVAFFKNAWLKYKKGGLTTSFGLIGLNAFKVQEKFWGRRYIYKSFQDAYKFSSSADLGAGIVYKFNDYFEGDLIISNGEGYKNIQLDTTYKAGLGFTVKPFGDMLIRAYVDWMNSDNPQMSVATFIGYSHSIFSTGIEYNFQGNHNVEENNDLSGISVYGDISTGKRTGIFARYDYIMSNKLSGEPDAWNIMNDGEMIIAGMEFNPVKGIRLSPNYQGWIPAGNRSLVSMFYLNLEVNF